MLKLNELSETELNELADKVEAMKPFDNFYYRFFSFFRRYLVTLWAAVVFPFVAHPIIAIAFIMLAFAYDRYIVSQAYDLRLTVRDIVFQFAKRWDDSVRTNDRAKLFLGKQQRDLFFKIIVGFVAGNLFFIYLGAATNFPITLGHWLYMAFYISILAWFMRYGNERLFSFYVPFQIAGFAVREQKKNVNPMIVVICGLFTLVFAIRAGRKAKSWKVFWEKWYRKSQKLFLVIFIPLMIFILSLGSMFLLINYYKFPDDKTPIDGLLLHSAGIELVFLLAPFAILLAQRGKYMLVGDIIADIYQLPDDVYRD